MTNTNLSIKHPLFFKSSALKGLRHGFFGRQGGVSTELVSSLNCYPFIRERMQKVDALENVQRNRKFILNALGVEVADVVTANQVHGDKIVMVRTFQPMGFEDADGLITDIPNLPIGVLTADCVPVLYTDAHHTVVGAVHAGWKGAFLNIHLKMIEKMNAMGIPSNQIKAVVGPSIQQGSYEVDQAFYDRVMLYKQTNIQYFYSSVKEHHYQFDLARFIYDDLMSVGLYTVDWVRLDTVIHDDVFFSYRCATLSGTAVTGRQMSVICL